jgi:imidazoleglycerol phosphate synthase glutamine amidotransferase subunit HisH
VGEGEQKWMMYFVHAYKNRTVKPDEIVLRRRGGEGK